MSGVTEQLASKVLGVVDAGLSKGLGEPVPGQMCVEAAVCYAMGLPHSDKPTCVSADVRNVKIGLNDRIQWSTSAARARGLRRLSVAQLGSAGAIDDAEFLRRVVTAAIKVFVPSALRSAAKANPNHAEALEAAATWCSIDPSIENAKKAQTAAYAAYAADAADAAGAAAYAADAAGAAAYAADAAAYAAAYAAASDKVAEGFCEAIVQILVDMKSPGAEFLYLTESPVV